VQQATSRYHREVNTSSGRDRRKKDTLVPIEGKRKEIDDAQIGGDSNWWESKFLIIFDNSIGGDTGWWRFKLKDCSKGAGCHLADKE